MTEDNRIRWKQTSGATLVLADGRKIKAGETFLATPEEISPAFRDTVKPVDPLPEEKALEVAPGGYTLKHRGGSWYDIVDSQGKVVNEKALRRDEAHDFLAALTPGEPVREVEQEEKPNPDIKPPEYTVVTEGFDPPGVERVLKAMKPEGAEE